MPDEIEDKPVDQQTEANASAAQVEDVTIEDEGDDGFDFASLEQAVETESLSQKDPAPQTPVVEKQVAAAPDGTPSTSTTPSTPPEASQPVVSPEGTSPQAAATPATPTSEAQPAPTSPQQPQAQPQAAATPVDGFTELDRAIEAGREKLVDAVAQKVYQLPAEELDAINTEPEKAIPRLLARVHVNTVQGVIRHVAQQIPAVVTGIIQAQQEYKKREDEFFQAWPQLDRSKHSAQILQVGQVFRQVNPNATLQDFIKHVGAQVVLMNGLHVQQAQQQQQQQQQTPPVQPAPAAFVPAGAGRTSQPTPPPDNNPWAELVEIMNE